MSGDEGMVLILCGALAGLVLGRWYGGVRRISPLAARGGSRTALAAFPVVAAAALLAVLVTASSWDVRSSALYTTFYLVMGIAWLGLVLKLMPLVGYDPRGDGLERGNVAVQPVVVGVGLGGVLAFAGGNVGDGPGWWVVVYCALLATGGLFLILSCVEVLAAPAEAVTIDRDLASGLRQGGLALALGLVLGRSVAGDWVSAGATSGDLLDTGWPALGIAALAVVVHRALRPTPTRPLRSPLAAGWLPGLLYVALAAVAVLAAGAPS